MNSKSHGPRILALDLRPQRFGYAAFEGSKRLLDYGANGFPPGGEMGAIVAGQRLAVLIALFHPSAIIVRSEYRRSAPRSPGVEPILKSIRQEARARSIPIHLMNSDDVSKASRLLGASTKYAIAVALTGMFPELLWKLPPKRRAWDPEPHAMAVFGAIALGFAYMERNQKQVPPPE